MAYSLSSKCTKIYWNQTTIVESIDGVWVVYFFATQCSYIQSVGNITVEIPHKFPAYWKLLIVNLSMALNIAGLRKLRESVVYVLLLYQGLRGAVAFALAMRNTSTMARQTILSATLIIVIVTVIFCGGFTTLVLQWLKIRSADHCRHCLHTVHLDHHKMFSNYTEKASCFTSAPKCTKCTKLCYTFTLPCNVPWHVTARCKSSFYYYYYLFSALELMVRRPSICLSVLSNDSGSQWVYCWAPCGSRYWLIAAATLWALCCRRRRSAANVGSIMLRADKGG